MLQSGLAKFTGMLRPHFPIDLAAAARHEVVRDTMGLPVVLGRLGSLEVRLATTRKDIRRAQKLRYKVFYEEMGATPTAAQQLSRRDKDAFDRVCDHLLVYDTPMSRGRSSGRRRRWWGPTGCSGRTWRRRTSASTRRRSSTSRR